MIGIIGAMDVEVAKLKEQMTEVEVTQKAGREYVKGILNGAEVVVVQAGVGKVNAAGCTQCLIDTYHVDYVINTGIAGSLQAKIDIGDVVLATDAVEHDMQAVAFGYPLGQIPGMKVFSFEADEALRKIAKESCEKVNPDIHVYEGRVLTGDEFVSGDEKKKWLVDTFGGYCTEMEGAAIAHTAYLNEVPFLIVRAISDKADNSAHEDYPTFEKKAVEHSVRLIMELAGRLQ
ncbi:MAG: 5'-methylthioadenosine/adenosylhomocysteine nucleosidase [Lachnospiraceae bacterium]|nr:5'-methylthioadenosine/adenosylhomocysteine nucleosidase [Lachnospiraceae bacterium]